MTHEIHPGSARRTEAARILFREWNGGLLTSHDDIATESEPWLAVEEETMARVWMAGCVAVDAGNPSASARKGSRARIEPGTREEEADLMKI